MNFKNERPITTTEGQRNPLSAPQFRMEAKGKFVEARVNLGMITQIDSADIPTGALQMARNARVVYDATSRRRGTTLLTPTKPDSNAVIGLSYHKTNDNSTYFFRYTSTKIYGRSGGSWTEYTADTGASLSGTVNDRFQSVTAFDRHIFTNRGADKLQELDVNTGKYALLGNAPAYKYITAFGNRIVGAYLMTPTENGAYVGWSGDGAIDEWDPLVDETAGGGPLVDSPSDLGDFCSGIFGFTNVLIVLREQSVWLATKQPIPTQPFYFYTAVPGLGCDCPDSAVIGDKALMWVDTRSGTVWMWAPGGEAPQPIGRPIEDQLFAGIDDPAQVFASYSPITGDYSICIPQSAYDYVIEWNFNRRTNAWTKNEREAITCVDDIDLATATTTIGDLGDLPIGALSGTIGDLSPTYDSTPTRVYGRSDGEITYEDETVYKDPVVSGSSNTTGAFTTEMVSKTFVAPTDDMYFSEVRVGYVPQTTTPITLHFSRDGGVTWSSVTKSVTPTAAMIGKPQLFRFVRTTKARRFAWKLTCDDGQLSVIEYEVHAYPGPESSR